MANGKRLLRLTAIVIALVGVLGFQMEAMGMLGSAADDANGRPDVIMIDTIARLGELEQSAAVFKHDVHTKALKAQGLSCQSCHKTDDKGVMALEFQTVGDAQTASAMKDLYHDGCITCHADTAGKNLKSGPMVGECRGCHQEKPEIVAKRVDADMDNLLHYAHWDSKEIPADAGQKTNCGACHKKQGKEDAWRFNPDFAKQPVNDAYHNKCVTCHQALIEKKAEKSGPVNCAGCHGQEQVAARKAAEARKLAAMGGELPRLPRKQPDAVLVMPALEKDAPKPEKGMGMAPVAFDHKAHEAGVDTCSACHTKGVNAPMDKSFEAMHSLTDSSSCIGCHAEIQKDPTCAGCHSLRPEKAAMAKDSCVACHVKTTPAGEDTRLLIAAPKEVKEAAAAAIIASRPDTHVKASVDAIPEFVNIGVIADKFKASKMPHRKIVQKLVDNMKDDGLASAFHATPEAVCQACHHNSPATLTPPKCASCHTVGADIMSGKPGLKAAYHGQCMGCHTEMKLEKPVATNCVACHEKKTN